MKFDEMLEVGGMICECYLRVLVRRLKRETMSADVAEAVEEVRKTFCVLAYHRHNQDFEDALLPGR